MVGNNTNGNICLVFLSIRYTGKLTNLITDCFDGIDIKNRVYILHYRSQTL